MTLTEIWSKELDAIALIPIEDKSHFKNLIAVLNTCETLSEKSNNKRKNSQLQTISRFFFSHASQLTQSVYELSKAGMGQGAMILCRSLFESLVDFHYLWLCKDIHGSYEERSAWALYSSISRGSIYRKWIRFRDHRLNNGFPEPENQFNTEIVEHHNNNVAIFNKKFNRGHWAWKSGLDQRARAVDDTKKIEGILFEEQYCYIYSWTSELVHGESTASSAYIRFNGNRISFIVGPDSKNIKAALAMAIHYMIMIMRLHAHIFHLEMHIEEHLETSGFQLQTP